MLLELYFKEKIFIMDKVNLKDKKVLLDILNTIDDMFNSTEKTIKEYVQDKSIDLNDRWEVFCKAGNLGLIGINNTYFEPNGLNWDKLTLYDNFHIEKYKQYKVDNMLEQAFEDGLFEDEEFDILKFKESCMQEFIFEAINYW